MTAKARRQRIKDCVDRLSGKTLQQAEDFIHWLSDRESWEATQELLAMPGLLEEVAEARGEAARGETVRWEELKRDLKRPRKSTPNRKGVSGRRRAGAGSRAR